MSLLGLPQLANRLIRMFSFVGDTVLSPGTTNITAAGCGRNSVGYEIYLALPQLCNQETRTSDLCYLNKTHLYIIR